MAYTVVGVFRHSGDADMAAAQLMEEYALYADELDIIGEAEWQNMTPPAPEGASGWFLTAVTGIGLPSARGDEDPLGKRWIDQLWEGHTLVVARSNDPDQARDMAQAMKRYGANRIDVMTH